MASASPLTLPVVAPPLPDVDEPSVKGARLIVVRPLVHDRWFYRAVEHDERQLRNVDVVDLREGLLPQPRIGCSHFLCVQSIQGMVAVESEVLSIRRDLVTREHAGIVGVIVKVVPPLGDIISARYGSRRRRGLPLRQDGAKERTT